MHPWPRLVVLLVLLPLSAQSPAPVLPLALAGIPTCERAVIGQPCPGLPATECIDLGPEQAPRCVSRCKSDGDCEKDFECIAIGRLGEGPKRCAPKVRPPGC